jgi:hypothetical protein
MANPITGAYQAHQTAQIDQPTQTSTTSKPVGNKPAPPQDTVTISKAAQAQQAAQQTKQTGADADHDGK